MKHDRPEPDAHAVHAVHDHVSLVRCLCERAERSMRRAARAIASSNARLERALRVTRAQRA